MLPLVQACIELQRGNSASAIQLLETIKAYQDFFALWKDGDPDILVLQEARREHEKLK